MTQLHQADPSKRTTRPIVTGASVLALKYKDGVMLACDTLASYGSMARFKDARRIAKVGDYTLIGASGEYSDFQYLTQTLDQLETNDWAAQDGQCLSPAEYSSYLCRLMYNRRSKMNPLWNSLVVAGHKDGKPYLGYVDMYGTAYEETYVASGFGSYFAVPLMRSHASPDMTEQEARDLLKKCLTILFSRDCQAYNKVQFALATADKVVIEEPIEVNPKWDYDGYMKKTKDLGLVGNSW